MSKHEVTIDDILAITVEADEQFNNFSLRFTNNSSENISPTDAAQFMVAQNQLRQLKNEQ